MNVADQIMRAADELSDELAPLLSPGRGPWGQARRALDPTRYARANYEAFVRRAVSGSRPAVIVGMNPGPHGMAQTGIPFGSVGVARQLIQYDQTRDEDRPSFTDDGATWRCAGLGYHRDEQSGRRLWGALVEIAGSIDAVLERAFVVNHCPLILLGIGCVNVPSAMLPRSDPRTVKLEAACDRHLQRVVEALGATRVLALGRHAESACRRAVSDRFAERVEVREAMHPSPRNGAWRQHADGALRWALGGGAS